MKRNYFFFFLFYVLFLLLRLSIKKKWWRLQITCKSLFYNDFLDWSYICDILMEPMFWFVENFTAWLGPVSYLQFYFYQNRDVIKI